jgi:hypothetical protein
MTEFEKALEIHAKLFGLSKTEAKEDAESIIRGMMASDGYTREFAEASFIEDTMDTDPEALKEMEKQAKENTKHRAHKAPANYSLDGKPKRPRKPNEEKRALVEAIASCLEDFHRNDEEDLVSHVESVEIVNPEREITFKIGEKCYSLTLTLHRPPKNAQK